MRGNKAHVTRTPCSELQAALSALQCFNVPEFQGSQLFL